MCYDFNASADFLQMAANARGTIIELAARVRELSSAIAQSDGMANGKERKEENYRSSNDIEQEISHLFRPRNAIIEEPVTNSSTGRLSAQPSDSEMKSVSSPTFAYQTTTPIYSVRRNFGGRSMLRKKQKTVTKRLVMEGPFLRDLVLLFGPNDNLVPRQSMKLWLSEHGHVISGIQLQKQWTREEVDECLRNAFADKISHLTVLEILMSVHTKLLPPKIGAGQSLNGMMVFRIFKEKPIYIRPSEALLLNPPKRSRRSEAVAEYEDSDTLELWSASDLSESHFFPSENHLSPPGMNHDNQRCRDEIQSRSVIDLTEEYNALLDTNLSDDDEIEYAPLEIKSEEASDGEETIKDILGRLTSPINIDQIAKFNVSRNHLWESARRGFAKKSFSPTYKVSVKFTDDAGASEGAVDLGDPTREFFTLLLNEIQKGSLFEGNSNNSDIKSLTCYTSSLNNGDYRLAGKIIAMSIVHGGSSPGFFSPVLFNALAYGPENTSVVLDDVTDQRLHGDLVALKDSTNDESVQKCLYNLEAITDLAGINTIIRKDDDKLRIIKDVAKWYTLGRTRPAIEEFKNGLSTLGLLDALQKSPGAFRDLFCLKEATLSSESIEKLFLMRRSETDSNDYIVESRIVMYWREYLQEVEEKEADSSFGDILAFSTGASKVPPLGFIPKPSIEFLHGSESRFPQANICGCVLKLPTMHSSYEAFKYNMDFAFRNCHGFGMP